ncbi:hypothetical protein [uncultured Actinomyces sp.]|uniref:hypothetical protein n=1 Tax=uncultured Actinomyces sp. TaxID=249061 RepID=UPI0015BD7639|nr:hypothetical protein [uncultured Actinomyces sp.]
MKRRIFGSLGAIAITGALALSAGTASADSTITLEEEYNFSSATKMTYTLRMSDSSGTVVTKEACEKAQSSGANTVFKQVNSSTTCAIFQDAPSDEVAKILKVSDDTFTFESQSRSVLTGLGSRMGIENMKVIATFPKGYRIESAVVPDGGDTQIAPTGDSVTWINVSTDVHTEGKIYSSSPSSTKWILLLILGVVVIGGIGAFVVVSNRKKKAQPQTGQFPLPPLGGQYPAPTGQPQSGVSPSQDQYPQAPQQPEQGQVPEQGEQPGQYPQA